MKNEFKLKFNLDVEKLKTQVSEEYNVGFSTISRKRQIWREQDNLFNGIVDQNKIDLKTVFYNVQAWMATYYTDKKTV